MCEHPVRRGIPPPWAVCGEGQEGEVRVSVARRVAVCPALLSMAAGTWGAGELQRRWGTVSMSEGPVLRDAPWVSAVWRAGHGFALCVRETEEASAARGAGRADPRGWGSAVLR